jgi:hypothetical protein
MEPEVMETTINRSSVIQVAPHQVACELNGQAVILNTESNIYYGLDDVGARIWSLIQQPCAFGQICEALMGEYEVDSQACERDTNDLIRKMAEAGLVQISS